MKKNKKNNNANNEPTGKKGYAKYLLFGFLSLIVLAVVTYASTTFNTNSGTISNTIINDSGIYTSGTKAYARTADVVVCRGTSVLDDLIKGFTCDVVCVSTDNDCGDDINNIIASGSKDIYLSRGTYPVSTTILINKNYVYLHGAGYSSIINVTTAIDGIKINNTQGIYKSFQILQSNSTSIGLHLSADSMSVIESELQDIIIQGTGYSGILIDRQAAYEFTTLKFTNVYVNGQSNNCINISAPSKVIMSNSVTEYCTTGIIDGAGIMTLTGHWFEGLTTGMALRGASYVTLIDPKWSSVTTKYTSTGSSGYNPVVFYLGAEPNQQFIIPQDINMTTKSGNVQTYNIYGINLTQQMQIKYVPIAQPVRCSATVEGLNYYNSSLHMPCWCNSTDWIRGDGVTKC